MAIIYIVEEVWQVTCTNHPCGWVLFQPYHYLALNDHLKITSMFCEIHNVQYIPFNLRLENKGK